MPPAPRISGKTKAGQRPPPPALSQKIPIPSDYGRSRKLRRHREPTVLVCVGRAIDDGKLIRLTPRAAAAWRRMQAAASGDGIVLLPLSGFRSIARQTQLIRKKLAVGKT